MLVAPAYDWISVHDESYIVPEVEEIPWHVSLASFVELGASLTPPSSPGFFSRLKEKGALAKDAWGVIGSAYVLIKPLDIHTDIST